jgi:hypothetical protein
VSASAARRARRASTKPPPGSGPGDRPNLSIAGATAHDAIRVSGREAFFEKTFALMESNDPAERAVAEFMLRGAWEALS